MEIFVDSADVDEIQKWLNMGVGDGVTTNPSIMLKDGLYDIQRGVKYIASLIYPRPVSVEVTTNDLNGMVGQAHEFASWAPNIVVKIPQETQDGILCYGVMRQLETEGVKVNATAALSLGQVILAAKSGATYVSVFAGRVGDEGGNPVEIIRQSVEWLEHWQCKSRLIVGSIRSVADILQAAMAWAHVITVPPQFLAKLGDHKYSRDTVRQFISDANQALSKMQMSKAVRT